jgi:glycosylphosphatidylinositol transamidase (GPIT) subunit GPI8
MHFDPLLAILSFLTMITLNSITNTRFVVWCVSLMGNAFGSIIVGDNDLGLAVIERWTHHFIENYHKRSNPRTTLHQSMVSPFDNKSVLMAHVGIKDDTSRHKFKDTKLTEFFGIKGGEKNSSELLDQTDTIVEISPESLLKLPRYTRDAASRNQKASRRSMNSPEESTVGTVCSAKKGDSLAKLSDIGLFIFICCLVVTLVFSKRIEEIILFR